MLNFIYFLILFISAATIYSDLKEIKEKLGIEDSNSKNRK